MTAHPRLIVTYFITPVAAGGPLLDGSPVTLLVGRDGSAELETDMLVLGCAAG